jgi:hypothetical protein
LRYIFTSFPTAKEINKQAEGHQHAPSSGSVLPVDRTIRLAARENARVLLAFRARTSGNMSFKNPFDGFRYVMQIIVAGSLLRRKLLEATRYRRLNDDLLNQARIPVSV